jgi:hypothetical protein
MYLCTCVSEEGGDGEGERSETPSLLSYTLTYVNFSEVGRGVVCRCDDRLKTKVEESTRLAHTGLRFLRINKAKAFKVSHLGSLRTRYVNLIYNSRGQAGYLQCAEARSANPGRNLHPTSAFLTTVAVFWRQLATRWRLG